MKTLNIKKYVLSDSEYSFLKESSLTEYYLYILYDFLKNIEFFNKPNDSDIVFLTHIYEKIKINNRYLFEISIEEIRQICVSIKAIHSKYVWIAYRNEKGRLLSKINNNYSFILSSHYLFKNIREKIFKFEFYKRYNLSIPNHLVISKSNINYSGFPQKNINVYKNVSYFLNYYESNCSFGVSSSVEEAVQKHHCPVNMVSFDISNFFNTFSIENIRKNNFYENIFNYFDELISDRSSIFYTVNKSKDFDKEKELFYLIFEAFSFNERLPTGSVFSSFISNLLFFSIDLKISLLIDNLCKEFIKEKKFVKISWLFIRDRISYTRYVDDIAISYNSTSFDFDFLISEKEKFTFVQINMSLIKAIEKILNLNSFYIKYEKTKIYSSKMDKQYLGFTYVRNKFKYTIKPNSNRKYRFNKLFYSFEKLDKKERNITYGLFQSLGFNKFNISKKTFLGKSIEETLGKNKIKNIIKKKNKFKFKSISNNLFSYIKKGL